MKAKLSIYSHPNHLTFRTAIEREQKQFIKIAFAVHLSAVISAERYRSDSGALKSAVSSTSVLPCTDVDSKFCISKTCKLEPSPSMAELIFVYFYIIMINKIEQSAAQRCLHPFELRVLPFGKTSGIKLLNLLSNPTDRTFENRRSRYKELGKKVPQAYRVYVEDAFLPCDAGDARIFSKEETGLYYYGARYLDPKYSRWLSGDPALNDYIPKAPIDDEAKKHNENLPGMGGVYNTVNLHVYHYAGNNPVKYIDPDGKQTAAAILNAKWKCLVQNLNQYIEMKHQVQDKIIKINHEINRKKGEIYDIAFNSVYKEINDFVNFYDIFDNSINAAMSNSGSFNMMLIAFLINIDVDALSGYLVDAYYAENMQTTGNEVNTSIFTKLMEIREMKAINASNKAELDNIEIEIADIKKKINELKLGDY